MTSTNIQRASRVCEYAIREDILPDLRFCDRYCEPGYDEPADGLILSANWNNRRRWDRETGKSIVTDARPERIARILERLGCELEWCDEWESCDECNGAVRTQPNGFCWVPSYQLVDECAIYCAECYDEAEGGAA